MGKAKQLRVSPIAGADARRLVQRWHYSKRFVSNSQLHFGVFDGDRCGGVMSFGPPMMRHQMLTLVRGTRWSEMVELNRMAFADWLPRNSESRALAVALRFIRKQYPHIKWVLTFADAVQCGDGAIYRAAGFVLTGIKKSDQIRELNGQRVTRFAMTKNVRTMPNGAASARGKVIPGHMLRYVYFLHAAERANLTVPEVPYARIAELGVGMYRGKRQTLCAGSIDSDVAADQAAEGGASPTPALQV